MKKLLLGTTGLVGAAFIASAAAAETPKVTVGGFIDFQAGYADDDLDAGLRDYGFRNDTEVSLRVDGKSDAGLGYGAVIDLEADVTGDADGEGVNAARTYVYLDGNFGRFELGSNEGAAETMAVDAADIARATGGIDGDWRFFTGTGNTTPGGAGYITTPSLPVDHGAVTAIGSETTENNNKITYYSPRMSGFQLGLSYAPDATDRGQTVTRSDVGTSAGDIFDLALAWEGDYENVGLGLSGAYKWGDGDSTVEDLGAWNLGALVEFSGLQLAASYADWDDSLQANGSSLDENDYYTLGAAYDFGPFGASVTWLDSNYETAAGDNEFENLVFGADYKLAPGLTPYAELSLFEFDAAAAGGTDNDGTVFLVGTQLAF